MKYPSFKVVLYSLVATLGIAVSHASAAPPHIDKINTDIKSVKKASAKNKSVRPVTTEVGDIEIVTDLSGKHFWQVKVRNTSKFDAKEFKVIVTFKGFRKQDKTRNVGTIEHLRAGQTAYARAELPSFEGMHQMVVKAGGKPKSYTIPRPFRRDANGSSASALEIEKVWVRTLNGTPHWYIKTKPNLYATIDTGKLHYLVYLRKRSNKLCWKDDFDTTIGVLDPTTPRLGASNSKPIRPGESVTLYGAIDKQTTKPFPKYFDKLIISSETGKRLKTKKLSPPYYPKSWMECD